MACGFDCGTYNLVCCRRDADKNFSHKREVNAFLEMPLENRFVFNMMKNAGVPLIERDNVAYALGEAAVDMAYTMSNIELKRPMCDGCVNPKEKYAFQIMSLMMHSLIGEVQKNKETLYYSVPANAINEETDADYHGKILQAIFAAYKSKEGYTVDAHPINEGLAIVYSELADKAFTGIGISCLCPGTKIYTKRGIVPIEDVRIGDEVITHKGRWKKVFNVVEKHFSGKMTNIKVTGYSGDINDYRFVDDHELYVSKDGRWQWKGCESIEVGDIVGEPILRHDIHAVRPNVILHIRKTSSPIVETKFFELSPSMCKLIGYFLGDGSVNKSEGCIQFDFANHEIENIEDVQCLISTVFGKKSSLTKKGENCTRIKCYSRAIRKWFSENCYHNKAKICPFELVSMTDEECKAMLVGMIRSDGDSSDDAVSFFNGDTTLVWLVKQLFSRCGIAASISHRAPREHTDGKGRLISGKKRCWTVTSGSKKCFDILEESLGLTEKVVSREGNKLSVDGGFCVSRVRHVEYGHYDGPVYDLQVSEDASFSAPYTCIKNCGGGMVNVCFSIFGAPVFTFAIVNSGDWIDRMAAKATGESIAYINREKTKIDLSKKPETLVERAIQTQYQLMLERTVNEIKRGLTEAGNKARTDKPVDIVVAGGTSSPPGFDLLFSEILEQAGLPIKVGKIVRPADPLYSVAKGCLIAAENASH